MIGEIVEDTAQFAMHASLWGPVVVFVLVAVVIKGVSVVRRIAASLLSAAALFVLLTGFWAGVLFRDGLAPDMVLIPSEGWDALERSAGSVLLGVLLAAVLGAVAFWTIKTAPRQPEGQAA